MHMRSRLFIVDGGRVRVRSRLCMSSVVAGGKQLGRGSAGSSGFGSLKGARERRVGVSSTIGLPGGATGGARGVHGTDMLRAAA